MRNLLQYPVTLDEKIKLLDKLIEEAQEPLLFGDMRAAILQQIKQDVEERSALVNALHDAIQRPLGVVPTSAEPFYDHKKVR